MEIHQLVKKKAKMYARFWACIAVSKVFYESIYGPTPEMTYVFAVRTPSTTNINAEQWCA